MTTKTTHGGKREGAGKPRTPIDERRVMYLVSNGVTQRDIAERFGVSQGVISRIVRIQKQAADLDGRAQAAIETIAT